MQFIDREEAGKKLADRLHEYAGTGAILLAIPRGGVPIAAVVSRMTGLPMSLLLVKKLGHPQNRDFAIGAIGLHDSYVFPTAGVSAKYIAQETEVIRDRLKTMQQHFSDDLPLPELDSRTVVVIDDGIATGNTVLAAVNILRRQGPSRVIVAVPVAAPHAIARVRKAADEVIALSSPEDFTGVEAYYLDFRQVTDEQVQRYLEPQRHKMVDTLTDPGELL